MPSKVQGITSDVVEGYKRIMVGYDGSQNADRALMRAANLAKLHGAALRIVVVVDTIVIASAPMAPPIPETVFKELQDDGKKTLSRAKDMVADIVPQATGTLEEGYPSVVILDKAAAEKSDLIVLGRRGLSRIERFLLGGVSSSVVSHSKCDVLVVK